MQFSFSRPAHLARRRGKPPRALRVERLEDRLVLDTGLLPGFFETPVASGFSGPTAMEFAPDGRLFVAEQEGKLWVVDNGVRVEQPFLSLNVDSSGERGLLGIAFDPDFANNDFLYVYYTTADSPIHNRVSRFTADGNSVVPGSEVPLLDLEDLGATNHNGGAIHFGTDGKLYVGVGENAVPANSQSTENRLGKLLRINSDGSIPADNPSLGSGINQSIWAMGLRNPYTFAVQPDSGRIFINDVGQNTWEEINDGQAGANYGWPDTEGPTDDPDFTSPFFAYQHNSGNPTGCAITGGTFYNPDTVQFPAEYNGDYFFADLCGSWIWRLDLPSGTASEFATGLPSQPVDLNVDASGDLYYLARGAGGNTGEVRKIEYGPQSISVADATIVEGNRGTRRLDVTLSISSPVALPVRIHYATADGTATAGADYVAKHGTARFRPGKTTAIVHLRIRGDLMAEADETFFLNLSDPKNAVLGDDQGQCTIQDDDSGAKPARGTIPLPVPATVDAFFAEIGGRSASRRRSSK